MAQIDTLTNVGAVVSTDLALILRGGANVLGTFGSLVGQNATAVTITGGTVNGTVIGGVTAAAGSFTTGAFSSTLGVTGAATIGGDIIGGAAGNPAVVTLNRAVKLDSTTSGHKVGINFSVADGVSNHRSVLYLDDSTGDTVIDRASTSGAMQFRIRQNGTDQFALSTTGAATFSGAVTLGSGIANNTIHLNNSTADMYLGISGGGLFGYASGAISAAFNSSAVPMGIGTAAAQDLILGTGSTARVTIDGTTGAATFSGNVGVGSAPTAWLDVAKDGNNTGTQFRVYDEEGAAPAIRTYTVSDPAGTLINSYYAVGGAPYVRYSDFVANNAASVATTMRFITKNAANVYSTGLTLNDSGAATFSAGITATTGTFSGVINGAGQSGGLVLDGAGTADNTIQFAGTGGNYYLGTNGSAGNRWVGSSAYAATFGSAGAYGLELATNNTVRLAISAAGAATFGGVVKASNLTTSGDSLYFLNDTNATATSYINFYGYQGGVTQFRNTVIANGKGTSILTLDGATKAANFSGNVGIGISNPNRKVVINDAADAYTLELRQDSAYNSGNQTGILFGAKYNVAGSNADVASIRGGKENTTDGDFGGKLAFYTRANGGSDTERLTISSTGAASFSGDTAAKHGTFFSGVAGEEIQISLGHSAGNMWTLGRENAVTGDLLFKDGGTSEKMRLTTSGNLLVGTTTAGAKLMVKSNATALLGFGVYGDTTGDTTYNIAQFGKYDNNSTTSQVFINFVINNGAAANGQINANGSGAVAFGSWSDRRLKENITDLPSQLANITALRPVEFDYIESEGGGHQLGFIAQEVEEIYPDLVGERQDGMKTLSGMGKMEARLIKAMQEQQAIIEALTARIEALEGA